MSIRDIHNPWRDRYRQASFRGVGFFIEGDARSSGRRTITHQYPKRNQPYAEDMGRDARRFKLVGFLLGPQYLVQKNYLITALEEDGPGWLQAPLPYLGVGDNVMVEKYSVQESREKGGFCQFDMEFVEFGEPGFASVAVMANAIVNQSATALESAVTKSGSLST